MFPKYFSEHFKKYKATLLRYSIYMPVFLLLAALTYAYAPDLTLSTLFDTLLEVSLLDSFIFLMLGVLCISALTLYDFIICRNFTHKTDFSNLFQISWIFNSILIFTEEYVRSKAGYAYLIYKYEGILSDDSFLSIVKQMLLPNKWLSTTPHQPLSRKTKRHLCMALSIKWLSKLAFFLYCFYYFDHAVNMPLILCLFVLGMLICGTLKLPTSFGVFELIVCIGCLVGDLSLATAFASLITFRLFYYIIPWFISMIVLSQKLSRLSLKRLIPSQKTALYHIHIRLLATLNFVAGLLLVLSASFFHTWDIVRDPTGLLNLLSTPITSLLLLSIGVALILLSKGIWAKVLPAYSLTLALLLVASCLSLLNFPQLKNTLILLVVAWALKSAKHIFYRPPAPPSLRAFITAFIIANIAYMSYVLLNPSWRHTQLTFASNLSSVGFVLYALLTLLLLAFLSGLAMLLSNQYICWEEVNDEDILKLKAFLERYEGNSMSHLLFLKDKHLFYALDNQVLIAFRPYKDKLIVLGDPIGDPALLGSGINAFRIFAKQHNMTPILYEVSEAMLPMYHENGFKFLKLGEEATLPLDTFTLIGKKGAALRTIKNKMLRGELTFTLIQPPFDTDLLDELHLISELWLDGRKEKTFSLGAFDTDYLNLAPIGIIKQNDMIIGFASIMPMYNKHSISIDLMRLIPDPPNGAMDALFIGLIEWAIAEGYENFVLGKAPLSNVGYNQFSPTKEKIVKYIYHYGNRIYSFKGLRRYKEKFHPEWKGIYLAYPKNTNLSVTVLQLTKMIGGSE